MTSPRPAGLRLTAILLLALTLRVVFFSGSPCAAFVMSARYTWPPPDRFD
jgi:hypothetical protein